jgi:hypothetical protein
VLLRLLLQCHVLLGLLGMWLLQWCVQLLRVGAKRRGTVQLQVRRELVELLRVKPAPSPAAAE